MSRDTERVQLDVASRWHSHIVIEAFRIIILLNSCLQLVVLDFLEEFLFAAFHVLAW